MEPRNPRETSSRRHGFTLVELLVAMGILFLLLTVLLVPIRMAFDSLNIGRSRSEVQLAAQGTVTQVEQDLRKAVFVFPNTEMPGVTDSKPYSDNNNEPYIRSTDTGNPDTFYGPCDPAGKRTAWGNTARIDLILPNTAAGVVTNPIRPARYVVTYYARRLDNTKAYDPFDNPIVLYRAQFPYKDGDDNDFHDDGVLAKPNNADLGPNRTPPTASCGSSSADINRQALWLSHNVYGEADLAPLCDTDAAVSGKPTVFASHILATPRGMALEAPGASDASNPSYQPNTSFLCEDSNGDGKIDRVTFNLILANYSASNETTANGIPKGQVLRYTRTIDLPNVR
jgi:prepilin-type N-terminal cleavage/methylation domain-containing protein